MPDHLPAGHRLVLSTDAHVISPLFFPGGDIGQLAVHGTVNDLAMMGATPLHLTVSVILEEGLPLADLVRIARSMADAAREAGVAIVTGDTKVVERGKGDGAYISTAGLGWVAPACTCRAPTPRWATPSCCPAPIGEHGLAVLSQREGLQFDSPIVSDTAPLNGLVRRCCAVAPVCASCATPRAAGVATSLDEIASASGVGMMLDEAAIPLPPPCKGRPELMGLDPLYLANEGKLLALCHPDDVDPLLAAMRAHPLGPQACAIGTSPKTPIIFVDAHRLRQLSYAGLVDG